MASAALDDTGDGENGERPPRRTTALDELQRLRAAVSASASFPTPQLDLALRRPRVGVGALLVRLSREGDGDVAPRVLVGRRLGSHGAGCFALPGGHLEHGEDWADCAAREVLEEAGISLAPARFAFTHATNDVMAAEGLHYVTLYVAARLSETECAQLANLEPEKCEAWRWETFAALREAGPLFSPLQHFLEQRGEARTLSALGL